jgi:hypothetical protein
MTVPNFIIAGERRSGSTTLYEILKKHSQIAMYGQSDMDFFIERDLFSMNQVEDVESWDDYANMDDYMAMFGATSNVTGQKDADLLWWKPAHKRLADHLPKTRFIFVLRNPVKRAESQYWNEVRKGREKRGFKESVSGTDRNHHSDWQKLHLEYKDRGCYVESLSHFFSHIPSERCHVVVLEQLFNNWDVEMKNIADFLAIDIDEAMLLKPLHSNKEEVLIIDPKYDHGFTGNVIKNYDRFCNAIIRRVVKDKHQKNKLQAYFLRLGKVSARAAHPVDKEVLSNLSNYYRPYNKALEQLLNIEIKEWD